MNAGRPTQREYGLEGTGSGDQQPGENPGKVIAHRDLQPTAAFHDRENRRNLRSRLWAADVQPILSGIEIFPYSKLCSLPDYVQSASPGWLSNHAQPAFVR